MNKLNFIIIVLLSSLTVNLALATSVPAKIDLRFLGCIINMNYTNSTDDQWHNYNYTESCSNQKNREANVLLQDNNIFIRIVADSGTMQQFFRIYHGEIVDTRNIKGVTIHKTTHRNNEGFIRYPTIRNDINGIISGNVSIRLAN